MSLIIFHRFHFVSPTTTVNYGGVAKTADDVSRSRSKENEEDLAQSASDYEENNSPGYEMLMNSIGGKVITRIARIMRVLWTWARMVMKIYEKVDMHYDEYHMHHEHVP